jgi:hypothetical protein
MMLNIHAKSPTKLQKDPPTCRRVEEVVVVVVFLPCVSFYVFTNALLLSSTIFASLI